MEITTCYTVKLKAQMKSVSTGKMNSANSFSGEAKVSAQLMRSTADECLAAFRMCFDIFLKEWDEIRQYPTSTKGSGKSRAECAAYSGRGRGR